MGTEQKHHDEMMGALMLLATKLETVFQALLLRPDHHTKEQTQAMIEARTAERIFAVRLGMLAQLDPLGLPPADQLARLALHCWDAARILTTAADPDVFSAVIAEAMTADSTTLAPSAVGMSSPH
jgi:hypothetical protein